MKNYALYDGLSGIFRWFGPAASVADAIRAFDQQAGGLNPQGAQRLGVHVGTEAQIAAIKRWVAFPKNGFPKDIGEATIYDATDLYMILRGWEAVSGELKAKLQANERSSSSGGAI